MEDKNNKATKSSNPKFALGVKKVPTHCIPPAVKLELGLAMMEGGRKYGTYNWREEGVKFTTYYDAVGRHMDACLEGEDNDPASGVHHVTKAIASLVVLRDSMLFGNFIDDRPQRQPGGFDMEKYNKKAEAIIEKYPDCKEPFTEVRKIREQQEQVVAEQDERDEVYGEFTIRKPQVLGKGWYVIEIKGTGAAGKPLFLHKDCRLHRGTGYYSHHKYAEAPGYFKSKTHARDCIESRRLMGILFGGEYVAR